MTSGVLKISTQSGIGMEILCFVGLEWIPRHWCWLNLAIGKEVDRVKAEKGYHEDHCGGRNMQRGRQDLHCCWPYGCLHPAGSARPAFQNWTRCVHSLSKFLLFVCYNSYSISETSWRSILDTILSIVEQFCGGILVDSIPRTDINVYVAIWGRQIS